MLSRIALLAWALLLIAPAFARDNTPSARELCHQAIPTVRDLWLRDLYDASPVVDVLMVDVIDGQLPQARRQFAQLKPTEVAHWRQLAMLTAASTGQAAVVDALLDDGAEVDGMGWIPPFKPSFYGQTVDSMKHDPRFGGPARVDGLAATGLLDNRGRRYGPALVIATQCGDLATVDVLLRHHADVTARQAPNIADALDTAVMEGNAAIVQRLLDHGASACMHDRLAQRRALKDKRRFIPLAEIGRRAGLSDELAARLSCPAVAFVR
jgi:hypothetical protein